MEEMFISVLIQDGQSLPGPIKFDLPTNVGTIPPSQVSCGHQMTVVMHFIYRKDTQLMKKLGPLWCHFQNSKSYILWYNFFCTQFFRFFSLYDGETRDKLLEAYSDNVSVSLCVCVSLLLFLFSLHSFSILLPYSLSSLGRIFFVCGLS